MALRMKCLVGSVTFFSKMLFHININIYIYNVPIIKIVENELIPKYSAVMFLIISTKM